jgi:hypothetical protein
MEIFGKDAAAQQKLLKMYQSKQLLFSPLRSSTLTSKGILKNVEFDEKECLAFECTPKVLTVDSNYIHIRWSLFDESAKKKSNRGRKKKVKKTKVRKIQGTGDCMNSQIQFGIIGQHIRKIPDFPDKHSKTQSDEETEIVILDNPETNIQDDDLNLNLNLNLDSESATFQELESSENIEKMNIAQIARKYLPKLEIPEGYELVIKKYKFLVFRNGRFTLPGVLTEDLSDAIEPTNELCRFLSREFWAEDGKVALAGIYATMRNYKFQLLQRKIDLLKLHEFCSKHFHTLLNIHFRHVRQYLVEEILNLINQPIINFTKLKPYLMNALPPKNLYVNFDKLQTELSKFDLVKNYKRVLSLQDLVYKYFQINIDDNLRSQIWSAYLSNFLRSLELRLTKDPDNMLSHIKYDPEKYPGFIIKIKTPLLDKKDKVTTIKLFKSGKIDIDGANNRQEAEFIYYWLNSLFVDNLELTFNPDELLADDEDGYSFSSEDP